MWARPKRRPYLLIPCWADFGCRIAKIRWRGWGSVRATGLGIGRVKTCEPFCVGSPVISVGAVQVVLTRRRKGRCNGEPANFYTRVRMVTAANVSQFNGTSRLQTGC